MCEWGENIKCIPLNVHPFSSKSFKGIELTFTLELYIPEIPIWNLLKTLLSLKTDFGITMFDKHQDQYNLVKCRFYFVLIQIEAEIRTFIGVHLNAHFLCSLNDFASTWYFWFCILGIQWVFSSKLGPNTGANPPNLMLDIWMVLTPPSLLSTVDYSYESIQNMAAIVSKL